MFTKSGALTKQLGDFGLGTQFPVTPGGGGGFNPLKIGSQWNQIFEAVDGTNSSGNAKGYVTRWAHYVGGGALARIIVTNMAWFIPLSSTSGTVSNVGNAIPIIEQSLEIGGVSVPVTYGGLRTVTLTDGSSDVQSDPVLPSAFSLANFAIGTKMWIKTKILFSGAGGVPYTSRTISNEASGALAWWYDPAVTTVSSSDTPGVYTSTGAAVVASQLSGYVPVILGNHVSSTAKAIIAVGDSLTDGLGDNVFSGSFPVGTGWFQRTIPMWATPPASMNFSIIGTQAAAGSTDARVTNFMKYGTGGVCFYGTNDMGFNGDTTPATLVTRIQARITQMKSMGTITKVVVPRLLERATSTDTWITEANQTTYPGWVSGAAVPQYNALVVGGTFDAIIPMDSIRGVNAFKWKVNGVANGYAYDETHPSAAGHAALATEAFPILSATL